ncbi:MAG: hypothetical protein ACO3LE_09410 [Bdellovibrionota bacterium]
MERILSRMGLICGGMIFLYGCGAIPEFQPRSQTAATTAPSQPDVEPDDPTAPESDDPTKIEAPISEPPPEVICDPLSADSMSSAVSSQNGLQGKLSYLLPDEPIAQSVFDFWIQNLMTGEYVATRGMDVELFSSNINVPTRSFDLGFVPMGPEAEALTTEAGDLLVENFGIHYQSNLILGEAAAGRYEVATLSDDGSYLRISEALSDGGDFILDNDGTHPTRMKCSTQVIELDESSELPLELFYHQGPRYHISLILMWRKLGDDEEAGRDSLCGASGNSLFFDFSQVPSVPKKAYLDLLSRGWEVIPSSSFLLPNNQMNPCVD